MTRKESDLILLGALRHTPGTRANYFINEAQKAGIGNETLLAELENSYQRFYKLVVHPKVDEWGVNDDGSHEPLYHWVNLYDYIGTPGTLNKDNISELMDIINDFRVCLPKDRPKDLIQVIMENALKAAQRINNPLLMDAVPAKDQKPKPVKTFLSHLVMDENKKQPFANGIKNQFPGIMGTKLGILLAAMEAENYIMLGTKSELYNSLSAFFGWDIGADSGINRTIKNLSPQKKEIEPYRAIIRNIYKSIV